MYMGWAIWVFPSGLVEMLKEVLRLQEDDEVPVDGGEVEKEW